jgi:hypothetical protein
MVSGVDGHCRGKQPKCGLCASMLSMKRAVLTSIELSVQVIHGSIGINKFFREFDFGLENVGGTSSQRGVSYSRFVKFCEADKLQPRATLACRARDKVSRHHCVRIQKLLTVILRSRALL